MRNFDNLNKTNEKDILVVKGPHLLRLVLLTNSCLFSLSSEIISRTIRTERFERSMYMWNYNNIIIKIMYYVAKYSTCTSVRCLL